MQEALDIYIKLLIAVISFIAPLLINLLSIFSDGVAVKKRKLKEFETQTAKLLKDQINEEGANVPALVNENSTVFRERAVSIQTQLDLLDPKKQVLYIFPLFFLSLLLIIVNQLVVDKKNMEWLFQNCPFWLSTGLILLSIVCAFFGVKRLKNVFWAIIEVKQEIAEEQEKEKSKLDNVTPV